MTNTTLENLRTLSNQKNDFEAFLCNRQYLEICYDAQKFQKFVYDTKTPSFQNEASDKTANQTLSEITSCSRALQSTPDGNCLFNSVSKLIQNNEQLSIELRLRTSIELAANIKFYSYHPDVKDLKINTISEKSFQSLEAIYDVAAFSDESSDIFGRSDFLQAVENEITRTSVLKNFSEIIQIMGLASVVGRPIQLVYPKSVLLRLRKHIYTKSYVLSK